MVVRSDLHTAQAREVAFSLIVANALIHKRYAVIDAFRIPSRVQCVPSSALVGKDSRQRADMIADIGNGITLVADNEGQ